MGNFGGTWTDKKLEKVKKYLEAYVQVMKNQPFKKIYIDAFAGEGYRNSNDNNCHDDEFDFLRLDELDESEDAKAMKAGSAIEALRVKPPFDRYIFIEKDHDKCSKLKDIIGSEFTGLKERIKIIPDDANHALRNICSQLDTFDRAVLFLDPFGMQVEWETIETIAKTQKIDMWYLFPSGIAVNRFLPHDANISQAISEKLDKLLGSHDWYDKFYEKREDRSLFDDEEHESYIRIANLQNIKEYLLMKLNATFAAVAQNPLPLMNSKNVEMYLLCFACSNNAGSRIALKIADYILQKP